MVLLPPKPSFCMRATCASCEKKSNEQSSSRTSGRHRRERQRQQTQQQQWYKHGGGGGRQLQLVVGGEWVLRTKLMPARGILKTTLFWMVASAVIAWK